MMCGGMLGAFTYCVRGGVFCNAQTGNIVLFGMAVGNANWKGEAYLLVPITAYGLGAAMTEVLKGSVKKAGLIRWDTLLVGFETLVTLLLGFVPESARFRFPSSRLILSVLCSTIRSARLRGYRW